MLIYTNVHTCSGVKYILKYFASCLIQKKVLTKHKIKVIIYFKGYVINREVKTMEDKNIISVMQLTTINKIIADMYDPSLPLHSRVINFMNSLSGLIYYDKGTIIFFRKDYNNIYHKHSSISINWEQNLNYVKQYNSYYCTIDDTLPVLDSQHPIIFKSSEFFDSSFRQNTEYWTDYLVPNNCIYSIDGNIQFSNDNNLLGGFSFYRGKEKSDFTDQDLFILQLFQPHLSNIMYNYGHLNETDNLPFMFENYNCMGLCFLDSNGEVVKSNAAFQKCIADKANNILPKIKNICYELKKDDTNKISEEYKFDDEPLFIEVSTIPKQSDRDNIHFCCLTYDLSKFVSLTLDNAKRKYTLTAREFEIVQAILRGKTNEEIASDLFLSLSTIKKYLASIYSKMEIKSQKQIFDKLNIL